jgi:hypothetical protein
MKRHKHKLKRRLEVAKMSCRLHRRYGHARKAHLYVWQVLLQVISPSRPGLRHQMQYRLQATSKDEAVAGAIVLAERDGNEVVEVVAAVCGYMIKEHQR